MAIRVLVLAAIVSFCSGPTTAGADLGVTYVANEGFLIEIGDAVLEQCREFFEGGGFPDGGVDVAFLEYFDQSMPTREILDRWIRADHIVFMHLPPENDRIEALSKTLSILFPGSRVFREPMQSTSFE